MMGERTGVQETLFYGFSLEQHVPDNHLLRSIDRLIDLSGIREHLRPFYSTMGRPSIDPELLIRMLLIGYCMGIRSERRLREVFEMTVRRCIETGLMGGEGFAVDASLIQADANRQRAVPGDEDLPPDATGRAVKEYLAVFDDAAFGASTPVVPKRLSPTDPAARYSAETPN